MRLIAGCGMAACPQKRRFLSVKGPDGPCRRGPGQPGLANFAYSSQSMNPMMILHMWPSSGPVSWGLGMLFCNHGMRRPRRYQSRRRTTPHCSLTYAPYIYSYACKDSGSSGAAWALNSLHFCSTDPRGCRQHKVHCMEALVPPHFAFGSAYRLKGAIGTCDYHFCGCHRPACLALMAGLQPNFGLHRGTSDRMKADRDSWLAMQDGTYSYK